MPYILGSPIPQFGRRTPCKNSICDVKKTVFHTKTRFFGQIFVFHTQKPVFCPLSRYWLTGFFKKLLSAASLGKTTTNNFHSKDSFPGFRVHELPLPLPHCPTSAKSMPLQCRPIYEMSGLPCDKFLAMKLPACNHACRCSPARKSSPTCAPPPLYVAQVFSQN